MGVEALHKSNNIDLFIHADVQSLFLDSSDRFKIAKKARENVVKNFSRDKMTSNTIQIYKEIIENMCKKLLANLVIEDYKIIEIQ